MVAREWDPRFESPGACMMMPPFRSQQRVDIAAPLDAVWSYNMDLSRIPEFHPRVSRVDLLGGTARREAGAAYRCHLSGGRHTCVERDIEIIPHEKIVTALPEDTFGISKILTDYVVESTLTALSDSSTRITISHFYSTPTLKARLLDLIVRRRISRDTRAMLKAMKAAIETAFASAARPG